MTQVIRQKIKFFPNHSKLIHGFVRISEADSSFSVPTVVISMILWFYGITVDIVTCGCMQKICSKRMRLFIGMKMNSFELYFTNIKFYAKLIIGVMKPVANGRFTGIVFWNNKHIYFRNDYFVYEDKTTIKSLNYSLKISINSYLQNKISYEIADGKFDNQYMYLPSLSHQHSKKREILFSSPIDTDVYQDNINYIYIHLFACNDSISLTNIKLN